MRYSRNILNLSASKLRSTGSLSRRYHVTGELLDDLGARGMLAQSTNHAAIAEQLRMRRTAVYMGIDPTAQALHIGHLLPLMALAHFHVHGHTTISVIGGATGLVGDPSGKRDERTPLAKQRISDNVTSLAAALEKFFGSLNPYLQSRLGSPTYDICPPVVKNNVEWLGKLNLLEFLTEAGRHARVPTMINRDSVKLRLASSAGLSFTEFTYQLLQAYDFLHLYRCNTCTIQIGGSDQWGNILAGVDLIEKWHAHKSDARVLSPHGLTTPLLTTASGAKFGKTEGNAIWLDSELTSVLDFYQFFLRTADADVEKYLKMFTFLPLEKISAVISEHEASPERRIAQRLLAEEMVELVHGEDAVRQARVATQVLFERDLEGLSVDEIANALADDPRLVRGVRSHVMGEPIWKLARAFDLVNSKSEGRRLAEAKGLYLNDVAVDPSRILLDSDLIDNGLAILRAGKDNHRVLIVV